MRRRGIDRSLRASFVSVSWGTIAQSSKDETSGETKNNYERNVAMSRSQLPLNALRAFEAAARHASFTHAAEELHVTQAAVSHQVKSLERHIGVALFRRLPRCLLLTAEGEGGTSAAWAVITSSGESP